MTRDRIDELQARFERQFGAPSSAHLARAPGRVNLIGEHTDYNGLPVFPMAIQRDIAILFRARDDERVRLCNVDERYAPREFAIAETIALFARGDWGNYVKCAAQALRRRARIARGIDAALHGDIPPAAGLSSSSAMVVASALALLRANEIEIERTELMSLLAEAERYIGTQSGGMDQAISLGGRKGEAVMIEFDPPRLTNVPVPCDWRFVIANTLVRAEKSGAAQIGYNERTRECRAALSELERSRAAVEAVRRGRSARNRSGAEGSAPRRAEGLAPRSDEHEARPMTYVDLVRDVSLESLLEIANGSLRDPLRRRFRHVVSEGQRVDEARRAMLSNDIAAFGRSMNDSHASLRDDYEVSCPELDRLVDVARSAGAQGARLTGAGFGGCIVALCEHEEQPSLVAALQREIEQLAKAVPPDVVMLAEPSDGARVEAISSRSAPHRDQHR
jgi:galactokinase